MLSDFIDCLILSSAIAKGEILVTEDRDIRDLRGRRKFQELLQAKNLKLEIRTLSEVS